MTSATATDCTAFDITDWLGEWESFEHYIDSDDATIQQTWEAAEQAVLANPKMALMAARGIKTFWSMAAPPPCALMREPPRIAAPSSEPCITCSK